jgi:hypothetical protein
MGAGFRTCPQCSAVSQPEDFVCRSCGHQLRDLDGASAQTFVGAGPQLSFFETDAWKAFWYPENRYGGRYFVAFLVLLLIGAFVWFYPARSTSFKQISLASASMRSLGGSGSHVPTECKVRLHNKSNKVLRLTSLNLYFADQQGHQCGVWRGFASDVVVPAHGGLDLKHQTPLPPGVAKQTAWVQAEVSVEVPHGKGSRSEHRRLARVART